MEGLPIGRRHWPIALIGFLLLIILAAVSPAFGGTLFRHVAGDDTLPNGALPTAMAEDREGFLWIGTQNGLARWDGFAFRIYRADPDNPFALPDNMVSVLHQARDGTLWVGTLNAGLARYDPLTDRFLASALPVARGSLRGISGIADATGDHVWVATGGGLFELDAAGRLLTRLAAGALPDVNINAVLQDAAGGLWIGGEHGLVRRPPLATRFTAVRLDGTSASDMAVQALAQDPFGRVWVGTHSDGAYRIETGADGAPVAIRPVLATQPAANVGSINAIETGPDAVWLGTGGGLITVEIHGLAATSLRHDPLSSTTVSEGAIMALHRDHTGLVWVAALHGIDEFDPAQRAISTLPGGRDEPGFLSMADVISVLALPDGHFWLGGRTGGIDILAPDGTRIGGLHPDPSRSNIALPGAGIHGLATGSDGGIYVSAGAGLYRADPSGKAIRRVRVPGRDDALRLNRICRQGDTLWLADPDGAWQIAMPSGAPPRLLRHLGAADLTDPRIVVFLAAPDGTFWIGTRNGLNRLAPGAATVERILPDRSRPGALSSGYISALVIDRSGRLWIGTADRGIDVWDGRDAAGRAQFRKLGRPEGLPDDGDDSIAVARDGTIWAATDGGLAVIDPHRLTIRALKAADGVAIPSFWAGAADVSAAGIIAFGGTAGLTLVRPELLAPMPFRAPLVVTETRLNGDPTWAGHTDPLGAIAPLAIPPGVRSLSVSFASLDYAAPLLTRYTYRLDGFDPSWISTDASSRTAAYTNLPPGHYTLRIRGSNHAGVWNEAGLALPIDVLPAWYQTLWWRAAETCFAVAAGLLLLRVRTRFLRHRQAQLERLVAARTEQLVQSEQNLRRAAYTDLLTGLDNRRAFNERFQTLVAAAGLGSHFALLLVDLDGFKQVNDTMGHDAGDDILVVTAERLRHSVRESDNIARLGGDEFAILLARDTTDNVVAVTCNRLVETLCAPVSIRGFSAKVGASIGVALFPEHGATQEVLYKSADLALYECKHAGRGVWRQFEAPKSIPCAASTLQPVN